MQIEVTFFQHPYGTTERMSKEIDDDYVEKYNLMRDLGCRITLEVLYEDVISENTMSISIEDPDVGDFICRLVKLEKDSTRTALESMLDEFDEDNFREWSDQYKAEEERYESGHYNEFNM